MPKRQSTAARRARQAARAGGKYTAELRAERGEHVDYPPPPEAPGPDLPPCPSLPFQVQHLSDPGYDGREPGYGGTTPRWWTLAWTDTADHARLLASAHVRWEGGARATQVWGPPDGHQDDAQDGQDDGQDGQDGHGGGRVLVARYDAGPAPRPPRPARPDGALPPGLRPASPEPAPLPAARPDVARHDVHRYCLRLWTPEGGWEVVGWFGGRSPACVLADELGVGVAGGRYPFGDVYGPGWRTGDPPRVLMDVLPDRRWLEQHAAGTYAELYHPDHAADRALAAARAKAEREAAWADPGPGPCGQCGKVRPLVWSWNICSPCYHASQFDPPTAEFLHPDPIDRDTDPDGRAETLADDRLSALHGE